MFRFCFSDPFFPLSFLVNSWFPGTLDAFFQALFLCALLLFWLCVYHGIRVQVSPRLYQYFNGSLSFLAYCESHFMCLCCFLRVRGNVWRSTCPNWSLWVFCGSQRLHWASGKRKSDLTDHYQLESICVKIKTEKSPKTVWSQNTRGLKRSTLLFWNCRVNELQDPTYQYKVDIVNFQVGTLNSHLDHSYEDEKGWRRRHKQWFVLMPLVSRGAGCGKGRDLVMWQHFFYLVHPVFMSSFAQQFKKVTCYFFRAWRSSSWL